MSNPSRHWISVRSDHDNLRLPLTEGSSVRQALDTTDLRVRAACGGMGSCGACLIQTLSGEFNQPTLAEYQKIPHEDLANGIRLACQLHPQTDCELYLQYPAPHSAWKSLDSDLNDAPSHQASGNNTITQQVYGVAIDLGTTHIRLSLWNRQTGRRIANRYSINPQIADGADVLTRLTANNQTHSSLTQIARLAIIEGIRDILCRDVGELSSILNQIGQVAIVGNTAMLTLICGNHDDSLYQPENWQHPIACLPSDVDAWKSAWHMPHADIHIVQPIAGFIGSDLLANLIATGMTQQPAPVMLADFGTNTEIALWDGQRLWITSVPGGPAFEGAGLRNGLSAEAGAIFNVVQEADGLQLHTIEAAPARGYCASGFIDAVCLLLDQQILKPSGRFAASQPGSYCLDADNPKSAIYASDIDMFQRAKASTAAAMSQLLKDANLKTGDLHTLWICGNFGRHLNLDHAIRLGLLPNVELDRIRPWANASLAGCEQYLLAADAASQTAQILDKIQVVNFGGHNEYENRFIDHLRLQPIHITEHS